MTIPSQSNPAQPQRVPHAISVDVEDWYQSTIDPDVPLSDRFIASTHKVLEAFGRAGIRGTFFVLGLAAQKCPQLVRDIAAAGHEVQSHGYGHLEVFKLTPEQFRQDLLRAKAMLEDLSGSAVFGYRAPSFSIDDSRTPWALDMLAQTGHRYDSSIFPIKMPRYGMDNYPLQPRVVTTAGSRRIVEAPLGCFDWMGRRWPVGGGGYFRLWPYPFLRKGFAAMERQGRSGVVYFHPYEYDTQEMAFYRSSVSLKMRLHQGLGRKRFAGKVARLARDFSLAPLKEVLKDLLGQV